MDTFVSLFRRLSAELNLIFPYDCSIEYHLFLLNYFLPIFPPYLNFRRMYKSPRRITSVHFQPDKRHWESNYYSTRYLWLERWTVSINFTVLLLIQISVPTYLSHSSLYICSCQSEPLHVLQFLFFLCHYLYYPLSLSLNLFFSLRFFFYSYQRT